METIKLIAVFWVMVWALLVLLVVIAAGCVDLAVRPAAEPFSLKDQFRTVNEKLDKILEHVETPKERKEKETEHQTKERGKHGK